MRKMRYVLDFCVQEKETKERWKPDADLAKVAYELSSKGRNTSLTTKLPGTC